MRDRKSTRLNSSHRYISYSLFFFLMTRRPPTSPLFPYTTLFRSDRWLSTGSTSVYCLRFNRSDGRGAVHARSEEHTSELQSPLHLLFPLFFFNDTAPTDISTLSLHDALPI